MTYHSGRSPSNSTRKRFERLNRLPQIAASLTFLVAACGDPTAVLVNSTAPSSRIMSSAPDLSFVQSQASATLGEIIVVAPGTTVAIATKLPSALKDRGGFGKVWSTSLNSLVSIIANPRGSVVSVHNGVGTGTITYRSMSGAEQSILKVRSSEQIRSIAFSDIPDTITVGATWSPYVVVTEVSGTATPTRSVLWGSGDTTVASLEALQGFRFRRSGVVEITAEAFGRVVKKVVTVRPPAVSAVITLNVPSLRPGDMAVASAIFFDKSGQSVSCSVIRWSISPMSGIVNMLPMSDSLRVALTAVAIGSATLNAACDSSPNSQKVISVVSGAPVDPNSPPPPIASGIVAISPATSMRVGENLTVDAQFSSANGTIVECPALAWTLSPASGIVSIQPISGSQRAKLVGLSVGSVSVSASCGAVAAPSKTVGVTASAPPIPGTEIALQIVRLDSSGSGTIFVSGGLPLSSGRLYDADVSGVRLMLGGVEIPRYAAALSGRHSNGSIRSILLQFSVNPSDLTKSLRLETSGRTLTALARTTPLAEPKAIAVLQNLDSLLATGIFGMTVTRANIPASPSYFQLYESNWDSYEAFHNSANEEITEQQYYDRILAYFAFWARTGNPKYFARGAQLARRYRDEFIVPANYQLPEWTAAMDGYAVHYWLTGDEVSRDVLINVASALNFARGGAILAQMTTHPWMDNRVQARVLGTKILAIQLGATSLPSLTPYGAAVPDLRAAAAADLTLILSNQNADGSYRSYSQCQQSKNFMSGMLNGVLGAYFDYVSPDPRILPSVQKSYDYMFGSQWLPAQASFNYLSGPCSGQGDATPAPDLNGLFVDGIAWLYRQTHSSTLRTYGDDVYRGGAVNTYLNGTKQFNQQYQMSWRWLGSR